MKWGNDNENDGNDYDDDFAIKKRKTSMVLTQNSMPIADKNEDLDLFKKASLALRYMSIIKGKDDIMQKSSHNLFKHAELGNFI